MDVNLSKGWEIFGSKEEVFTENIIPVKIRSLYRNDLAIYL